MAEESVKRKRSLYQEYHKEISNPIDLVFTAANGVNISMFDSLITLTGLSKNQLAAFIDVSPKTIDNHRIRQRRLGRMESEQVLQILSLYKKGEEIFGSMEAFNQWLVIPSFGLGKKKPFELMYTPGGIQLIMEELIRIEFGALA